MKPRINLSLSTVILATALSLSAGAQTNTSLVLAKNTGVAGMSTDSKTITGTINLPGKLVGNFNKNFPMAQNAKWTVTGDAYLASFTDGGKLVNASFTRKGQFVYALIYAKATDLPDFIQHDIKKSYPSATVYKVVEMKKPGVVDYEVILQNATEYINLKITQDGQMQEEKRITKAEG